eukprot:5480011-Ditylum_brightwellii.AAC.1
MSTANEQGLFDHGVFVPYGIHMKEGPAFLKNLMRTHNKYVKEIKCIAIEGMSYTSVWSPAPMENDPDATIAEHFL